MPSRSRRVWTTSDLWCPLWPCTSACSAELGNTVPTAVPRSSTTALHAGITLPGTLYDPPAVSTFNVISYKLWVFRLFTHINFRNQTSSRMRIVRCSGRGRGVLSGESAQGVSVQGCLPWGVCLGAVWPGEYTTPPFL